PAGSRWTCGCGCSTRSFGKRRLWMRGRRRRGWRGGLGQSRIRLRVCSRPLRALLLKRNFVAVKMALGLLSVLAVLLQGPDRPITPEIGEALQLRARLGVEDQWS